MTPSFAWGVHFELAISTYRSATLSIPAVSSDAELAEKDVLTQGDADADGKYTIEEHLASLDAEQFGRTSSFLVLGLRNSLVNLRAPVLIRGYVHAVEGEDPRLSRRPYYGLASRGGRLCIGQALGGVEEIWPDFFVAGIPVLWDDLDAEALFDIILTEAADHSHVFTLPRGNHPEATDLSRRSWSTLHAAFAQSIHDDAPTAVSKMQSALSNLDQPLVRCSNYLNAIVGIRADGTVISICAHGRLEALGRRAKELGCRRAVCLENSGSVMPTYLPAGLTGEHIPLLRAPNFRPRGRAALILELENNHFDSSVMLYR